MIAAVGAMVQDAVCVGFPMDEAAKEEVYALTDIEGCDRRVPQVSLLRPGIPQTNPYWKHPRLCLVLGQQVLDAHRKFADAHAGGVVHSGSNSRGDPGETYLPYSAYPERVKDLIGI